MPKLPNDKQYQLWALIDGKPKDLGVFDVSDQKFILKMKNTRKLMPLLLPSSRKAALLHPRSKKCNRWVSSNRSDESMKKYCINNKKARSAGLFYLF